MQAEVNDANLGLANSRIPPTWCVENDARYPLRYYRHDLEVWSASTDMDVLRQGPAASMRITGSARTVVREMPIALLTGGQQVPDGAGGLVQLNGLGMLLRTLERRYGATDQETQIHTISELMGFSKLSGESTDQLLARFEVILHRADAIGGIALGPQLKAWMILSHLRIPRNSWMTLLSPTMGMLPADLDEFTAFQQYIRRNGHLFDTGHNADRQKTIMQPYFTNDSSTFFAETSEQNPQSRNAAFPAFHDWHGVHEQQQTQDDDGISWHSYSTGQSDYDEPLDWSDFPNNISEPYIGEEIYLAYTGAKRRWRSFGGKGRHRQKGKGKGRGKSKGSSSSKGPHSQVRAFWTDDYGVNHIIDEAPVYFKGKGKGNPIGKDGKQMLCSICDSNQHFRAKCSKGAGKGKSGFGKGKGTGAFFASDMHDQWHYDSHATAATQHQTAPAIPTASSSLAQPRKVYFAVPTAASRAVEQKSQIFFADGSPSIQLTAVKHPDYEAIAMNLAAKEVPSSETPATSSQHLHKYYHPPAYAWFNEASYHAMVKLKIGEALLVDTGAVGNLAGANTFQRLVEFATRNGQGTEFTPLDRKMNIDGVGGGDPSVCKRSGKVPIVLGDGQIASYAAPLIEDSDVPCLLGLHTMIGMRVVLDLVHDKWISLGPGGMELKLSPGSSVLDLHRAPTGHIMLPCSDWQKLQGKGANATVVALPAMEL